MKLLIEGLFKEMDNAKLLMLGCVASLLLANLGLILHLMFVDGSTVQGTLNFLESEITLLIPTSGVVSVIQHGVAAYFVNKKQAQPPAA